MTKDEIKERYTMRDILVKCGLHQPNRAGFIQCPFHSGDREPSLKIYEKDYNCFGCGANGDIFSFIQNFYQISFKEAFAMLGGTYEKPTFSTNLAIYRRKQAQKMRQKNEEELQRKRNFNNILITIYREWVQKSEPLSETWCDCYNALQYQLHVHDALNNGGRK